MKQTLDNQRGMALLLVLVIVALLSALLTELAFSTLVDLRLAETFRDSTRAAYLAKGGVRVGQIILEEDNRSSIYSKYDHPSELWSMGVINYPVGDGTVSVTITDLEGRININRLVRTTELNTDQADDVVKKRLLQLLIDLDISNPEELTAAIIDWVDIGNGPYDGFLNIGVTGAEEDYYMNLKTPYHCKNAPLDSIEELSLIRGFTPETIKKIKDHVTVYGGEKLNINTATLQVLHAWYSYHDTSLDMSLAEKIIAAREKEPITNAMVIGDGELPINWQQDFDFKSNTFLIEARGEVNSGKRRVDAVVRKSGKLLYLKVN